MRKTYAYNSIIIGVLLGIAVGATTKSVILGVIVGIATSVVGFFIIKLIENALYNAANKATNKITESHQRRKAEKMRSYNDISMQKTQFPSQRIPSNDSVNNNDLICPQCGAVLPRGAAFCAYCGTKIQ